MTAIVVSFSDYRPAPRFDGVSWRHALIYEGPSATGPWTQIDNIALSADADPAHPQLRNFTTSLATIPAGWYYVVFTDAVSAAEQATTPIQNNAASQQSYLPSITDVALKDLARTKDTFGNELGTFNANTRPTDTQVSQMIVRLAPEVADMIGDTIPASLQDDAAQVVAERVAMQIELDYYPDQVNTNRSIYPQLKEQYEMNLTRLARQVAMVAEDGSTGAVGAGIGGSPSYSFPTADVDWLTRRM